MFKDIKSISIKGGFFDDGKAIELFKENDDRLSFIYGRNGSGKTSISNAFIDLKSDDYSTYNVIKLNDFNQRDITLSDEEKKKLYVFNETFIDSKIKFSEDGMNTIVMFGQQIELEDDFKKCSEEINNINTELKKAVEVRNLINDETNSMSPKYHFSKITDLLRGNTSWASREQKIKNLSRKGTVNEVVISSILAESYKKDVKGEIADLEKNIAFLSNVSTDATKYQELDFNCSLKDNYEKELMNLLSKKVEKPELTDREKLIFDIIEKGMQENISSAKEYFSDDVSFCPYCFQSVNTDYRESLLKSFKTVLNEMVEEHINKLSEVTLSILNLDVTPYVTLNPSLCSSITNKVKAFNEHVEFINSQINKKKKNVYIPISISNLKVKKYYDELLSDVVALKKEINIYNEKIDNISKTTTESQRLNKIISRNEIDAHLKLYNEALAKKEKSDVLIESLTKQSTELKGKIAEINAKKKNFDIALKKINNDLEYIFFGKDRLSLICENEKYMVLSYGQKVELKKLSVGERNAIALCYFFTHILENTDETNDYKNDFFLVVDDPISSFDFENKIGMYSFLRLKLDKILKNNSGNKVVIFTHEIEAMINFQKFKEEFNDYDLSYFTIKDKQTKKFEKIDKNGYTQAFHMMYNYALNPNVHDDLIIGNQMRKILEAFSTFQCKNSIEHFMRDEDILQLIPEELKDYFGNFMYRLVLNGESHFSDQAISYPENNFYEYVSRDEKQQTAKTLLSFIYIINPIHVKKQLGNNLDYIKNVEMWKQELLQNHQK